MRALWAPSPSGVGVIADTPRGLLLHASRSGRPRLVEDEFDGTVNWAVSGAAGLAWHVTVGPWCYAAHLAPDVWGWHARGFSARWVGIEFSQANLGEPIGEGQIAAAVAYLVGELVPRWPDLDLLRPGAMVEHWQADQLLGRPDGKTDVAPDEPGVLAGRLRSALALTPALSRWERETRGE